MRTLEASGDRRSEVGATDVVSGLRPPVSDIRNALTIDFEDWFCVSNMNHLIDRKDWDLCELRVEGSAGRVLDLLDRHGTKATFFVLGWIADRVPGLVREIERRGHEIASHGYGHRMVTDLSAAEFEDDLERGLEALRKAGVTQEIIGFRAPSFSIVERTTWALPILERRRFKYDSSMMPVGFHPDYGVPNGPLRPFKVTDGMTELPLSCIELFGRRVPCCGGAYFRLLPYAFTRYGIRRCHAEGRGVVFYFHPWEIDPNQPRMKLPLAKQIRHYYGLRHTERKLERLLTDFRFTTIREVLGL
ncbi:MAG TPA: XrtA system polysaccharide deacetylase [Vicinamibacterales bacterium]